MFIPLCAPLSAHNTYIYLAVHIRNNTCIYIRVCVRCCLPSPRITVIAELPFYIHGASWTSDQNDGSFVMMGERRSGKGQIRGCPLSSELLLVLLLLLARAGSSGSCDLRNLDVVAVPWTVAFGNCSFAGNSKGARLVRTGSCLTQAGALSLQSKCITALPTDAFQGMPLMTSLDLSYNALSTLPAGVFAGLTSLSTLNLACQNFGNVFRDLPAGVFSSLAALRTLVLTGNPQLQCAPLNAQDLVSLLDYQGPVLCGASGSGPSGIVNYDGVIVTSDLAMTCTCEEGYIQGMKEYLCSQPPRLNPECWGGGKSLYWTNGTMVMSRGYGTGLQCRIWHWTAPENITANIVTSCLVRDQATVIIGAVVGVTVVMVCILAASYYLRCWQSKSTPIPQLTPVEQPQYDHRPPEQNPFFGLTVGGVYNIPGWCANLAGGVAQVGGGLPETKAQEQVLRARRDLRAESKEPGGVPNEPTEDRDVCKISLADLEIAAESLAAGSFKEVFFARLRNTLPGIGHAGLKVAVIKFRHGNSTLGAELKVFKTLGRHPNLTRLLAVTYSDSGVVTSLVTEFAERGSLDYVLSNLSGRHESATADVLLTATMQVLDGMLQLQEHKIVHRDLALRNLLVFRFHASECDQMHVKLTDYGLASTGTCVQMSTSSVGDGVPVRWMPPEAILRRRWSEKSDVWAFAVTVWEMFTHGLVPYTFIFSDSEVGQRVAGGHRLERPMTPTECPPGVFSVMLKCWEEEAEARPTFAELKSIILVEFRVGRQGECCICLERKLLSDLLALVPCGHRCVCADHASHIVGCPCPMCRTKAEQVIRVFD